MPFVQAIIVLQTKDVKITIVKLTHILKISQNTYLIGNKLYDNALRVDYLYSKIDIGTMPFMQAITVNNYSVITFYIIVAISNMQTNNEYFLLLVMTKNTVIFFK